MAWGEEAGDGDDDAVGSTASVKPLAAPTADQLSAFRQIVLAAFPDHVARRADDKSAGPGPMPYECTILRDKLVYIHPGSGMGILGG